MKIAILGAGYTGISLAYLLSKHNHSITVFEKEKVPGGLAVGFRQKNWRWSLEQHYHHLFTSDKEILELAREVCHPIHFIKPKTSIYYKGKISRFDNPTSLLAFPHLSLIAKMRTGILISFLKINPFWKPLEKISAKKFLILIGGKESWKILWKPLFSSKFGNYTPKIPASWFWARIKKRTKVFGYPKAGFQELYKSIAKKAFKQGVRIKLNTDIKKIVNANNQFKIILQENKRFKENEFDIVISTLPSPITAKIFPQMNKEYLRKLKKVKNRGAINLVLSLKKQFLPDMTYWLNINDLGFPFLGVVEHTNFADFQKYGNNHIIYIGNYLPPDHPYFQKSKQELLNIFLPYLQKINSEFNKKWILKSWKFSAPFAQPIMTLNYSQNVPSHQTPIKNLFIANMQQVYPWDRQTNYAVAMAKKIDKLMSPA
jgi:protoporphyrinogen oxidase